MPKRPNMESQTAKVRPKVPNMEPPSAKVEPKGANMQLQSVQVEPEEPNMGSIGAQLGSHHQPKNSRGCESAVRGTKLRKPPQQSVAIAIRSEGKSNTLFRPPCTADSLAGWPPSLYQGLVFDLEFNVEMLRGKN